MYRENSHLKSCIHLGVHSSTTVTETRKQPKCPLTPVDKEMVHTYTTEYYLATESEIMPFASTLRDPEIITLSEISQKNKYHMILLAV